MEVGSGAFSATRIEDTGEAGVILRGELDMATAATLATVLAGFLEGPSEEVIVDCSGLSFIDSSGVSVLIVAQRELQERGRYLTVRAPKPPTLRVLETTGLVEFLNVEVEESPEGRSP